MSDNIDFMTWHLLRNMYFFSIAASTGFLAVVSQLEDEDDRPLIYCVSHDDVSMLPGR